VSAYVNALKAAVASEQAQRAAKERASIKAARERLTPLEERLPQDGAEFRGCKVGRGLVPSHSRAAAGR
jgi:hypothetical protein